MQQPFSTPVVTLRPSLPGDRQDVIEFCKTIWEGRDYIPEVFDEWLVDPRGQMFTAVYSGRAIGLARLVQPAPGQWWLEGLRVDPQFQGQKIGTRLHRYALNWWLEHGDGTLRLWTNTWRVKVHHLCEQDGFIRTMERAPYTAPPLPSSTSTDLIPLAESELPEAIEFALRPDFSPRERGMLDACWQAITPDEIALRWLAKNFAGRAFWWRGRQGLVFSWHAEEHGQVISMIGLLSCAEADIPAILTELRQHPTQGGYDILSWRAPVRPELDAALQGAGFVREDGDAVYQYEKTTQRAVPGQNDESPPRISP